MLTIERDVKPARALADEIARTATALSGSPAPAN